MPAVVTGPLPANERLHEEAVKKLERDSLQILVSAMRDISCLKSNDRSPAALAVIMADAAVGLLTGDVGAGRRAAKSLARGTLAGLRPAAMKTDCYESMESRFYYAWNDYAQCLVDVMWSSFYQSLCGWRWLLQVESYWFGFLTCSGASW